LQVLLNSIGLASKVVSVPRGTLHLKTDCALVDEETVLATEALASSGLLDGFRTLVVPEEERGAANALRVNQVLFVRAGCPRTLAMLVRHGATVVTLPVSEIAKIDAGLSCMSLRWLDRQIGRPC
jgi:dimethylargininase